MKEFDRDYIEVELAKLAAKLRRPIVLHVIGGGAMAFQDLKAGTKDIDVVLQTEDEADALIAALLSIGYKDPGDLTAPYARMAARRVLENADGFRWDVFVREVMGFEYSPAMRARAEPWLQDAHLAVFAVAPEDIFAFKALTDRERDRADMNVLFTAGLDTDVIRAEVLRQAERREGKRFASFFYTGLSEFVERFGVLYPGVEEFEGLDAREHLAELMHSRISDGPVSIRRFVEEVEVEEELVEEAAERLVRQGLARRDGDRVTKAG